MDSNFASFMLDVLPFIAVGFVAQMIDGALGMAYGVSSTSLLMSIGISPASASASVHTAEVFTTAASGISHWRLGNVDKQLIKRLIIPGVLGGITGAYILTSVPSNTIKPIVSIYLLIMGLVILWKAFKRTVTSTPKTPLVPLGLAGGFFDAIGGGGWGPIVTTTLVARGGAPRFTIGSVNLSEFFVTFAEAVTFLATIGLVHLNVILGLIIGGVIAAPLGAYICRKLPSRAMMIVVGILIVGLQIRTLVLSVL
jgi:uncharacterized membrane protein YfcA